MHSLTVSMDIASGLLSAPKLEAAGTPSASQCLPVPPSPNAAAIVEILAEP